MKKIIQKTFTNLALVGVSFFVLTSTQALAQEDVSWIDQSASTYQYNYDTYTNPNVDYVTSSYTTGNDVSWIDQNASTYQYNYNTYTNPNVDYVTSSYTTGNDVSWIDQNPSTYQYNYNTYTNPNVDYVTSSYTTGNDVGWIDQNPSTYQYNYNTYTNPNVDYVTSNCYGCDTSSSVTPTYTTSPSYSTVPTYTTGDTSNNYTVPTYTTTPSYTYTTPTYTSNNYTVPTYTTPAYTTIPTTNNTICSNGSYPVNGVCSVTTTIPTTSTTICSNGSYPVNGVCSVTTTIPTVNNQICSNGQAPVNGNCTVTTVIPSVNNTICSNGSAPVNGNCTITRTIPFVSNTICSNGSAPVNGSCTVTNTIPTTVTTLCSNGQAPVNGSCAITNTIPVTVNTRCSDGTYPVNGSCTVTNTIPTVVSTICSDGLLRNLDGTCTRTNIIPATQVCFDGSRIPAAQTCPSQYKTCPNGTSVLYNQSCYSTPVVTPPTVVKFNNVVTSIATQITNTSGRCNGIGLIANGVSSTGWFEYGETANLGRLTASAAIGTAVSAPFSNVLANLKPSTKYYCRAVMQNQYGVVKGEIVSFVTKAKVTTYVKPVVTKKPVVTTKKVQTVKKSTVVTCSDGSTLPVKDSTSAAILSEGGKLITLEIQKLEGSLSQNAPVAYKVVYKNTSATRLTDVVVKVVLPAEVKLLSSTAGNYDEGTHTLTLNQNTMDMYSEGVISLSGVLVKDAPIGKTIVATAYIVYTVPGTHTQDEVTSYVVGSIVPVENVSKADTGAKKVIGTSERGFMPSNLVEWLALIAIIFIIFILARSIYVSYKEGEGDVHGH